MIKRYTTFINRFSNPLLFYTNWTNKHIHTQESRFNNKDSTFNEIDEEWFRKAASVLIHDTSGGRGEDE